MKPLGSILLLLALTTCPSLSQWRLGAVYLQTGYAFPMSSSSFHDSWKPGVNLSAGIGAEEDNNRLSYIMQLEYNVYDFDVDHYASSVNVPADQITAGGGASSHIGFAVRLKYATIGGEKLFLYVTGGVEALYVIVDAADLTIAGVTSHVNGSARTAFGVPFGVGIEVEIHGKLSLFAESKYVLGVLQGSDPRLSHAAIDAGLRLPVD